MVNIKIQSIKKNRSPLTLQCSDEKILAKCLAHRIEKVLSDIDHLSRPDLSSFVYVSILGWLGRELGWAFYVCISMCLAWCGSQSEAAVSRCL